VPDELNASIVHLTADGVSMVLAPSPSGVPCILHWGTALGSLDEAGLVGLVDLHRPGVPFSALDQPRWHGIVGESVAGFTGMPALEGSRPGAGGRVQAWAPRLRDWSWSTSHDEDCVVRLAADDREAGWRVLLDLELTREGVVRSRTSVTNIGAGPLVLHAVRSALPVPARATELLDLTGRWCRERTPQRREWSLGAHVRESRHGRTGHDATLVMVAGEPSFGFRRGQVWGVHVAWSGDHTTYAERTPEGECLLGGYELLGPAEVILDEGGSYTSPWLLGAWSPEGMDGISDRLHRWIRRQRDERTARPRPVLINTWEASYFDHDLAKLTSLADAAADVGAERFVLDDGWFMGRRHDQAGLGDWTVDPVVWRDGLHPLIDHVKARGMDFGLWVEPEMISENSELARQHPDWILRGRRELPDSWRFQQVLDLQVPEAYTYIRDALLALLDEYDIAFLKWDHNRDLVDVAHDARPAVHGQTLALYRLLDEIRRRHPDLEIESCSSGGARVDLGILSRTDRVWPSDTIDAVERQRIQRWTALLVPPEMMGAHVGGPIAHTSGRQAGLSFRAATALIGHFGIEWDLTTVTAEERDEIRDWISLHKQMRPTIATGRLVRVDAHDPALVIQGVVAADASHAWYVVATVDSVVTQSAGVVTLPGLDPDRVYRVRSVTPQGKRHQTELGASWLDTDGVEVPGSVLAVLGVRLPVMAPETAHVIYASAVE